MGIHMTAIANHNLRFEKPEACLRQLSERTGLPWVITPFIDDAQDLGYELPQDFFGWVAQPYEPDFNKEYDQQGCFEAYLNEDIDLYIGKHFFMAPEPDDTGRWTFTAHALLQPYGSHLNGYSEATIKIFDALRFRLYRMVQRMGGDTALYFASNNDKLVWDGFSQFHTLEQVVALARRKGLPVYRYPEDKALMATLPFSENGYNMVLVDSFSDFAHYPWH